MQPHVSKNGLLCKSNHSMKKQLILLSVVLLVTITAGLAQNRETRNVDTFNKIAFRLPGKVYVRQGDTQKVEIEASKDILSRVETEVEGSKLVIHSPGKWNWKGDERITAYITVKNIEGLSVSGSGDMIGEGKFNTGDLDLNVSGSGSLKIEVASSGELEADLSGSGELMVTGSCRSFDSDVSGSGRVVMDVNVSNEADFQISGSGKIEARGKASKVSTTISGSGKVLGENFEATRVDVRISGSGDVEIAVKDELDATISGSGTVSYKGNPGKVNSHSSGSGRVTKL